MATQNQDQAVGTDPCCPEGDMSTSQGQTGTGQWQVMGEGMEGSTPQMRAKARDAISQAAEAARRQASQAAEQARCYANERIDEGKRWTAEELSHAAAAVRTAAQKLREEHHDEPLAGYAETLAGWAEQSANYVRDLQLDDVAQEARSMIRQRPEWVLGGLFLAGLALGRFLKASNGAPHSSLPDGYGQQEMEAGWAPESGQSEPQRHSPPHSPGHEASSVTGVSTI